MLRWRENVVVGELYSCHVEQAAHKRVSFVALRRKIQHHSLLFSHTITALLERERESNGRDQVVATANSRKYHEERTRNVSDVTVEEGLYLVRSFGARGF